MNGGDVVFHFKGNTTDIESKTNSLSSKLGSVGSSIGSAFVKGCAVAGTAMVGLVGTAVKAFADIEQSYGGMESIFGGIENGADQITQVTKYAQTAWKDLTMSQNEYYENFNSTYPLMKNDIEDQNEAIEKTNELLQLESDLSNTFGYDMETATTAINWALKGTFSYLDNLNIGIKGTQEGFLEAAHNVGYMVDSVDELSSSDILDIIEQTASQYGVLGKTAAEASTTISGSMKSAKAAFTDFLSGSGNIDAVVTSFETAGTNIMNAVNKLAPQIVSGIVTLINALIPQLPGLINTLLPTVLQGVIDLFNGIVGALPTLVQMLGEMLPTILQSLLTGLVTIIQSLADQMPVLIPQIINAILDMIPVLIDNLPLFIKAGFQLITGIAQGLLNAVPGLLARIPGIIKSILNYFKQMPEMAKDIGSNLIKGLWNGISNLGQWCINKIKSLGSSILKAVKNIFGVHSPSTEFAAIGRFNMIGLVEGTEKMKQKVIDAYSDVLDMSNFDNMFDLSPSLYGSTSTNISPQVNVVVNNSYETDPLGQLVNNVKTFSGGAKNDYNYGTGV